MDRKILLFVGALCLGSCSMEGTTELGMVTDGYFYDFQAIKYYDTSSWEEMTYPSYEVEHDAMLDNLDEAYSSFEGFTYRKLERTYLYGEVNGTTYYNNLPYLLEEVETFIVLDQTSPTYFHRTRVNHHYLNGTRGIEQHIHYLYLEEGETLSLYHEEIDDASIGHSERSFYVESHNIDVVDEGRNHLVGLEENRDHVLNSEVPLHDEEGNLSLEFDYSYEVGDTSTKGTVKNVYEDGIVSYAKSVSRTNVSTTLTRKVVTELRMAHNEHLSFELQADLDDYGLLVV